MTAQEFRPQIKIGDFVSLNKWDGTERCKIGSPAQVIKIEADECSETGIMVTLRGKFGQIIRVDMNWLEDKNEA